MIGETPQKLCAIKGITEEKAAAISREFHRLYGVREVVAWFAQFGLSAQNAVTAYRRFGPHTVEALTQNPYLLCGEPLQLKFGQVDGIAAALQFESGSRLRVAAGLLYALRHNAGNGHTCLPRAKLLASTARFLRVEPDAIEAGLQEMLQTGELCARTFADTEYIYLPDLLAPRRTSAARLGELSTFPTEAPRTLESDIRALEITQGFAYAPLQKEAIRLALSSRVMVLTGGPGTGKTTTVNAILSLYEALYDRVALCAPTGRAAKRLSELTGHNASTIHRLLEVDYTTGAVRFIHNEKNLLKYDVIILDEMSMVGRQAVPGAAGRGAPALPHHHGRRRRPAAQRRARQHSGRDPARRRRAHRAPDRDLPPGAAKPHRAERPPHRAGADAAKRRRAGRLFPDRIGRLACQRLVCDLVATRLPKAYGLDPVRDIQVLCPTKVGPTGSVELNARLQALLNPAGARQTRSWRRERRQDPALGDKVMQIKNDYDITFERAGAEAGVGAYNGDLGVHHGRRPRRALGHRDDGRPQVRLFGRSAL